MEMRGKTRVRKLGGQCGLALLVGAVVIGVGAATASASGPAQAVSRFGSPPAKPNLGGRSVHASDEAGTLGGSAIYSAQEAEFGEVTPAGGRGPASAAEIQMTKTVDQTALLSSESNIKELKMREASRKGTQEVSLIVSDLGYFPNTIFVSRGVPVRLFVTGSSKNPLCLIMDSFEVRKQIRTQKVEEISFLPEHPGKYRFYCPMNGMEGTLVVRELSTDRTPASSESAASESTD
jgi:plastocyanin